MAHPMHWTQESETLHMVEKSLLSRSIQHLSIKIFNSFGSNGLSKSIYWSCTALESSEEHNRLSSSAIFCSLAYVTPVAVGRHFSFTPPSTQRHWPLSLVLVIYYKPMINGVPLHLRLEYKVQTVFLFCFYLGGNFWKCVHSWKGIWQVLE